LLVGQRKAMSDFNRRSNASERIAEIGEILALGLIRMRARKSSSLVSDRGESSLDCLGTRSGHAGNEPETAQR